MKIGVSISVDVTKIDKSRLFNGEKGVYADLTTFIDLDQKDQYDNNGFISQSQTKEERENNAPHTPILGNVKVFYQEGAEITQTNSAPPANNFDNSDIPF